MRCARCSWYYQHLAKGRRAAPCWINSARDRILAYLRKYPKTLIAGNELMVVAGIDDWARRVRELRVEFGWAIYTGATLEGAISDDPEILNELSELLGLEEVLCCRAFLAWYSAGVSFFPNITTLAPNYRIEMEFLNRGFN